VSRCPKAVTVEITSLDGSPVEERWDPGDRLELLPGTHLISLQLGWNAVGRQDVITGLLLLPVSVATSRSAAANVTVHVEAGRTYSLVAKVPADDTAEVAVHGTEP
jgi:hypothetical protein